MIKLFRPEDNGRKRMVTMSDPREVPFHPDGDGFTVARLAEKWPNHENWLRDRGYRLVESEAPEGWEVNGQWYNLEELS